MNFAALTRILKDQLATKRVVIAGSCHSGKTTLAKEFPGYVYHTDSLIETHEWSEVSEEAAKWMQEDGPWLIEGVAASRALRKALAASGVPDGGVSHPDWEFPTKPCDVVIRLTTPVSEVNKNHVAMNKGEATVWAKIKEDLLARGVIVIDFVDDTHITMQQGTEVVQF